MPDPAFTFERAKQFALEHRIRISAGTAVLAAVLILSTPDASTPWFVFLLPIVIGALIPLLSHEGTTLEINGWREFYAQQLAVAEERGGNIARYFLRPLFTGSLKLYESTEGLADQNVRAGVRLAFLALFWTVMVTGFVLVMWVIVAFMILVAAIAIASWFMSDGRRGSSREEGPSRRPDIWNRPIRRPGFFSKDIVHVDEKGGMHRPQGLTGTKVGRIDEEGKVYDASFIEQRLGRIDDDGVVYEGSGWSESRVGKLDQEGRLVDVSFIGEEVKK